jgi:hypothetical protein
MLYTYETNTQLQEHKEGNYRNFLISITQDQKNENYLQPHNNVSSITWLAQYYFVLCSLQEQNLIRLERERES